MRYVVTVLRLILMAFVGPLSPGGGNPVPKGPQGQKRPADVIGNTV